MRNLFISIVALVAAAYMGLAPLYVVFILGIPATAPAMDGSLVSNVLNVLLLVACYTCSAVLSHIAYVHVKH